MELAIQLKVVPLHRSNHPIIVYLEITEASMSSSPSPLPSNRKFGALFAVLFAAAGGWKYHQTGNLGVLLFCSVLSAAFALATLLAPDLLTPLNKAWFHLGQLMGKVVSPVVLGVFFVVLITPAAVLSRLFGRDALRLKRPKAASYWIDRVPPGPAPGSFKNQF